MKDSLTSTIKSKRGSFSFFVQPKKEAITIFCEIEKKGLFAICLKKTQLLFIDHNHCVCNYVLCENDHPLGQRVTAKFQTLPIKRKYKF